MLNESEIDLIKLLAVIFAALLVATLLMGWWDSSGKKYLTRWLGKKGWIEKDPAKASLNRLKRVSIFYAIAILFLVMFRLPAIIHVVTTQGTASQEELIQLREDLYRMKEVIYIGLMINMFWFGAVYGVLKEIVIKNSNNESLENSSDNRISPIPRREF
jgi:hypothetical protein